MKSFWPSLSFAKITIFLFSFLLGTSATQTHESFLKCLTTQISKSNTTSTSKSIIYTRNNPSYSTIFNSTAQNPRFVTPTTRKPVVIVTPLRNSHIQASIYCSKKYGVQIRIRSGGHDYEGLSYTSNVTFFILDMRNLSSIDVDVASKSAWVQSGATVGQLHYRIAEKNLNLAFPGGVGDTIGIGGQLGGGGYGYSTRKYGLSADHILDAQLIDAQGRILNRETMGEDLFWAIRGGGAASFGVVVAWKVQLVDMPSIVTLIESPRKWVDNATKKFIHRYQRRAHKVDKDLTLIVRFLAVNSSDKGGKKIQADITGLFHGRKERLLPLMKKEFPELGLLEAECTEMTFVQAVLYFNVFTNGQSLDFLLNRELTFKYQPVKVKSDYVKKPIPDDVIEKLVDRLYEEEVLDGYIEFFPYGGKMDEIPESAIPFPHRAGNIYNLRYTVLWEEYENENTTSVNEHLSWARSAYNYMTPYVSKNPRGAFLNFRDLDIGINPIHCDVKNNYNCFQQASVWGTKYFKDNFYRLVDVKTKVDPTNYFTYEQSIPPLLSH